MTISEAKSILHCPDAYGGIHGEKYGQALAVAFECMSVCASAGRWIPVKWHEITEEERDREGYPEEYVTFLDNPMPNDDEEILVTVKNRRGQVWVEKDTCVIDDGCYLDSGYDWVEDIVAWMPLPKPYKEAVENDLR